jgi:hypothetical protein
MNVQAPFGFVTGCHAGDKFMVQATLASMRHYCPDVPICLVVDGTFDVSDLERDYGVIPLRVPELPSAEMRALISGNYRAKLAAMWEGPFEFYVWLDLDAIVWGDFISHVRRDVDFQLFWNEISISPDTVEIPSRLPHFYFDPQSYGNLTLNLIGGDGLIFVRAHLPAGEMPYHLSTGQSLSHGQNNHPVCLRGERWEC